MKLGQSIKVFDRKSGKRTDETITVIDSLPGANKVLTTAEHSKVPHYKDVDGDAQVFWVGDWEEEPKSWKATAKPSKKSKK